MQLFALVAAAGKTPVALLYLPLQDANLPASSKSAFSSPGKGLLWLGKGLLRQADFPSS